MDEIAAEQERILKEFRELEDPMARYSYLLALASLLPSSPDDLKSPDYAVKGCQSSVWLKAWAEDGRFRFIADSDTYIIKGLLYLLINVLDGRPLAEASEAELYFWRDEMLLGSFDDSRKKGISYVAATLRARARALMNETMDKTAEI